MMHLAPKGTARPHPRPAKGKPRLPDHLSSLPHPPAPPSPRVGEGRGEGAASPKACR
jgi:hypothetical protein